MDVKYFFGYFPMLYKEAGDIWLEKWNKLLDMIGDDEVTLYIYGTTVLIFSVHWIYAAFFTFVDLTNRPKFLRKYKYQPGKNDPVDPKKFMNAMKFVLINLTFTNLLSNYLAYHVFYKHNMPEIPIRQLPSFLTILWQIAIFPVLDEIISYYSHRLLHHKMFYKYIHKKHHEWTAPIATVALYCYPIEYFIIDAMPFMITMWIFRAHIITIWIKSALVILTTMNIHTGYTFIFPSKVVRLHDIHHEKFNYNYGFYGWYDKLHGTYKEVINQRNEDKEL